MSIARFAKFNGVGALGIAVQLSVVHVLLTQTSVGIATATAGGVGAAVIHNFAWHRRWTWADRSDDRHALRTFARFVATNGLVSLAGGVAVATAVAMAGVPGLAANAIAIVACGLVNFIVSDRVVSPGPRRTHGPRHETCANATTAPERVDDAGGSPPSRSTSGGLPRRGS